MLILIWFNCEYDLILSFYSKKMFKLIFDFTETYSYEILNILEKFDVLKTYVFYG